MLTQAATFNRERRAFLGRAARAATGCLISLPGALEAVHRKARVLFDGRSLKGWIQVENSATSFSANDIIDFSELASQIGAKSTGVATFLNDSLDDALRLRLAALSQMGSDERKSVRSALAKNLNRIISGPLIYERDRFAGVAMRPEDAKLVRRDLCGRELVELNRRLLEDAFPGALASIQAGWTVKDGAMASTGSGRGVIFTAHDYARFRLKFTVRHISGNPDHQACVLIFCNRPTSDEIPLDALGGIQFQVPRGGHGITGQDITTPEVTNSPK